jgi:hypothetical protein
MNNTLLENKAVANGTISLPDKLSWNEPLPLPEIRTVSVSSLSPEMLPAPLSTWLTDIAHRLQCPLDFVAVGAMVTLSAIIGTGCAIRPKHKDDWTVIPNLWGGIVARPSMLKTPSLSEIMKPINKIEQDAKEDFKAQENFYKLDKELHKAQYDAIISEIKAISKNKPSTSKTLDTIKEEYAALREPINPVRQRYITSDATVEKLGELLNQNERGILIFRDELVSLLASWNGEDKQSDRAFYLEAWTGGQPFTTDRIGRGTIDIKSCCVSVLGGIQPSKLLAFLMQSAKNLQNDGMLQRFQLLVYPDEIRMWTYVDEKPHAYARKTAHNIFEKLAKMDFNAVGATTENGRPFFRFNDAAQDIFIFWMRKLQSKIDKERNPLIAEHLAKYRSLMPSIALILHLTDIAAGLTTESEIPHTIAETAEDWCDYLESHARRIYGLLSGTEEKAVIALAKKIQNNEIKSPFTVRDIYRKHWSLLDDKFKVEDACCELEELGWIKRVLKPLENRQPQVSFYINPKIKIYK